MAKTTAESLAKTFGQDSDSDERQFFLTGQNTGSDERPANITGQSTRYWIGGSGSWSDTAHWSTSDGGSGGASIPTYEDNVFVTPNSGFGSGGTVTLTDDAECLNFTCTSGHTWTLAGDYNWLYFNGSVTFEAGLTIDDESYLSYCGYGEAGDFTITTNGATIRAAQSDFDGDGYILGDDYITDSPDYDSTLNLYGIFDANDFDIKATSVYMSSGSEVKMGSGTWEVASQGFTGNGSLDSETSLIKFTGSSGYSRNFTGNGKTYYDFRNAQEGAGAVVISGSNTFNDITITSTSAPTRVATGSSQTFNNLYATGSAGNLINLTSAETTIAGGGGNSATQVKLYSGSITKVCQSLEGNGTLLSKITQFIGSTGTPSGNIRIEIYAHTGTFGTDGLPTGSVLATSGNVAAANGMWSSYQFTFTGANQIELEDGVYYDAVLIFEGGDASNYIYVNVNSKNYYLGNAGYYDGSWHAYSNSYDLYYFYVYGIGAHNLISNGNDVVCDYLDLSLSSASGGIFYAGLNSTDSGDNEGWIFGSPANDSRSSVSFGGDGRYVEDFSTTTKKDAGNTTASWTGDGTAEMT